MPTFPETIGKWVRGERLEYPPPMGFSVPYYLEDGTHASIYLYRGGYDWIPPGPDSPQVQEQFQQSKAEVYAAQEPGIWRDVHHLGDDTIQLGSDTEPIQALRATFNLRDSAGESGFSQLILTAAQNLLVKVRLSFRNSGGQDWQASVDLLLRWVGQQLVSQPKLWADNDEVDRRTTPTGDKPMSGDSPQNPDQQRAEALAREAIDKAESGDYASAVRLIEEACRLDAVRSLDLYDLYRVEFHRLAGNQAPLECMEAYNDGVTAGRNGDYAKAISAYERAIAFDPSFPWAPNNLAWMLATCPASSVHDGERAIELGQRACDLPDRPCWNFLNTLAAAHARHGGLWPCRAAYQEHAGNHA